MSTESVGHWLQSFSSSKEQTLRKTKAQKISITGGKGGVGKTSISLKIAKELSRLGMKVLLIDCDFNMSNTAIKLGLPLTDNFSSLIMAEKSFEDCLYHEGNFHLLSACNGSLDIFESKLRFEEIIIDIICSHEFSYDFILLDCPAGMSAQSLTLNAYCDERFMVVTPDKSSITDSYALIKVLSKKYGINTNSLIVNQYRNKNQFNKVVKTMSETVEHYLDGRTHLLAGIPRMQPKNEEFDSFFLSDRSKENFSKFVKAVEALADRFSERRNHVHMNSMSVQRKSEQEVQLNP